MTNVYKENYDLKKENESMREDFSKIMTVIYCIGGPLNDNVNRYSKKQLKPFWEIALIAEGWKP